MSDNKKTLTGRQRQIVLEFQINYGIDPEQINFDGKDETPILDYEAISQLSLNLTDIQDISCSIVQTNEANGKIVACCTVTLPDGRSRSVDASAFIGEKLYDETEVNSAIFAEALARSRATRVAIRSVGINLMKAHKEYLASGKVVNGHTNNDPRHPQYQEINVIAHKMGLKTKNSREGYERFLAENFEGLTSAKDLDDIQLHRFVILLRSLNRIGYGVNKKKAA